MPTSPDSTSLVASLIHFHLSTLIGFYWALTAVGFLNGMLCLIRLKRLKEKHHLYWGALLVVVAWALPSTGLGWALRLIGTELIVDDSIQHAVQVYDVANGKPPRPDWSLDHKIGVWIMLKLGWTS